MAHEALPTDAGTRGAFSLVLLFSQSSFLAPSDPGLRLALEVEHLAAGRRVLASRATWLRGQQGRPCERRGKALLAGQGEELAAFARWLGLTRQSLRVHGAADPEYDVIEIVQLFVRFFDVSGASPDDERGYLHLDLSPDYGGPDAERLSSFFAALLQICDLRDDPLWRQLVHGSGRQLLEFCPACGARVTPYHPRKAAPVETARREAPPDLACDSFYWCAQCRSVQVAPECDATGEACRSCAARAPLGCRYCPGCGTEVGG